MGQHLLRSDAQTEGNSHAWRTRRVKRNGQHPPSARRATQLGHLVGRDPASPPLGQPVIDIGALPAGSAVRELGALERRLSELLGAPVDLIPAAALRPDLRDLVLAEAMTL